MKILVSGFEPFAVHTENSSQKIVERLVVSDSLHTLLLPVTFDEAFKKLAQEIETFKPDIVLALGLAARRDVISLEKVAINLIDCEYPDNAGLSYQNTPIIPGAANAYFSELPLNHMREVASAFFPTEISYSAGAYVCNYLFYHLLHLQQTSEFGAGFIHLPELNESADQILMSVKAMIEVLSREKRDP